MLFSVPMMHGSSCSSAYWIIAAVDPITSACRSTSAGSSGSVSYTHLIGSVSVSDWSVVTSGIYERCFTYEAAFYHHILDPQTGYPVANGLQAVTILSESSATADALSTASFLLGADEAKALIESLPDTEAIFITLDGSVETTSGIGTQIPFEQKALEMCIRDSRSSRIGPQLCHDSVRLPRLARQKQAAALFFHDVLSGLQHRLLYLAVCPEFFWRIRSGRHLYV